MKKIIGLLFISLAIFNCSKRAEVTWDTSLYAEPELKTEILKIKKGSVVDALEFRNHEWNVKESIKVKFEGKTGYIPSSKAVVGQNPEKSVFKWGYRKDYKKFYDPNDKKHYKSGYTFGNLDKLPKEKIPLEELLKDTQVEEE